jgi:hypothetical protein
MPMMALLMALPLATARVAAAPPFSWETVPVFAETSNVSGVFDAEALAVLARFPVFVGEKAYAYREPGFAEDKLSHLAATLRELNKDIFLIFYFNANLDMDDYRLNNVTEVHAPDWWLRNSSNVPFLAPVDSGKGSRPPFPYSKGLHVFDFTVPDMREAWVNECMTMTSTGGFDSCTYSGEYNAINGPKTGAS